MSSAASHLSAEAKASLPRHVAVIMDGNGRWAKARGLPRIEGHRQGAESARVIIRTAGELGIRYLTLYAFSAENCLVGPLGEELLLATAQHLETALA